MKDAIRDRRSIRKFTGEPVPEGVIDEILDAGRRAPSGKRLRLAAHPVFVHAWCS